MVGARRAESIVGIRREGGYIREDEGDRTKTNVGNNALRWSKGRSVGASFGAHLVVQFVSLKLLLTAREHSLQSCQWPHVRVTSWGMPKLLA